MLVSVQSPEYADVLNIGHMMMIVAVNKTRKRDTNNAKDIMYGRVQ